MRLCIRYSSVMDKLVWMPTSKVPYILTHLPIFFETFQNLGTDETDAANSIQSFIDIVHVIWRCY